MISLKELFGPTKLLRCDRKNFNLHLYKRNRFHAEFQLDRTYKIAVGQPHLRTPPGYYVIHSKSRHPDYQYPYSDWVPKELQGKYFKYGDLVNPIMGRWIGVTDDKDGVGIHGTAEDASIGSAASHGCIRMHVADVIELFDIV